MKNFLIGHVTTLKLRLEQIFTKDDQLTIALGILGFVLIYMHFPFDWSLPEYALY